jgi:hypothetical protein
MGNACRIAALVALLTALFLPFVASAYPATEQPCWKSAPYVTTCQSSAAAAADLAGAAYCNAAGASCTAYGGFVNAEFVSHLSATVDSYKIHYHYYSTVTYTILSMSNMPTLGCPGGGTLSGSTCTCAQGETDTGSSCTSPDACPGNQFRRTAVSDCEDKCQIGQYQGAQVFATGVSKACVKARDYVFVDAPEWQDAVTGDKWKCNVEASSENIKCGTFDGVEGCYSHARVVESGPCTSETVINGAAPSDVPTCPAEDDWCGNPDNGPCPSTHVGGSINGESICIKKGKSVTATPQPKSTISPPPADPATPRPPLGDRPTDDSTAGEGLTPADRTVIGIGDVNTASPGGGGGGGGEIITCGLPGTPKCKIDEAGTPEDGDFTAASTALDAAAAARTEGLGTVTSATNKNTTWAWTMQLPTGCQPITVDLIVRTFSVDPCAYQGVMHDLLSLLWAGSTLFAVFGMVGRTLRES